MRRHDGGGGWVGSDGGEGRNCSEVDVRNDSVIPVLYVSGKTVETVHYFFECTVSRHLGATGITQVNRSLSAVSSRSFSLSHIQVG